MPHSISELAPHDVWTWISFAAGPCCSNGGTVLSRSELKRFWYIYPLESFVYPLNNWAQAPVSRKSQNFSGDRILFVSSKRRGLKARNFIIYFNLYPLHKIWKDQLCRVRGSEFHKWLFGPEKFLGFSRNETLVSNYKKHLWGTSGLFPF